VVGFWITITVANFGDGVVPFHSGLLLFLPPYSPDFNSIAPYSSKINALPRAQSPQRLGAAKGVRLSLVCSLRGDAEHGSLILIKPSTNENNAQVRTFIYRQKGH
jgi:hypothetical protein